MRSFRMGLIFGLALLLMVSGARAADGPAKAEGKKLRVFFAGNSVTDMVNYGAFGKLCAGGGVELVFARHVIPGAPLFYLWKADEDKKESGFTVKPYGGSIHAMNNYAWDAVSLEPFDRKLAAPANAKPGDYDESDTANVQKYIDAEVKQNADCQFYIYSRWPRMRDVDGKSVTFDAKAYLDPQQKKEALPAKLQSWQKLWDRKYTGGWDGSEESKDYFEKLTLAVRKANPTLKKPVLMVPVRQVMAALEKKMADGQVAGYTTIWQVYNDGIHLDSVGQYVVGCTFYATLTGRDPTGLGAEAYGVKDAAIAKAIGQTVWEVVGKEELAMPAKGAGK